MKSYRWKVSEDLLTDRDFSEKLNDKRIKKLELSDNHIYGVLAAEAATNLAEHRNLHTLLLNNNQIGILSIEKFASTLAKNSSIKVLSLAGNTLNCEGVSILLKHLSSSTSQSIIEDLDLTNTNFYTLDELTIKNITKLKLKKLILNNNQLTDTSLLNLIQNLKKNEHLTELSCNSACIQTAMFSDLLLLAENHKLKSLSFSGANLILNDKSRAFLCDLIKAKFSHLEFKLWNINEELHSEFAKTPGFDIKEIDCIQVLIKKIGKFDNQNFFKKIEQTPTLPDEKDRISPSLSLS